GSFVRLSPLNYTLYASATYGTSILEAYAITFNYFSNLAQNTANGQNMTYPIPRFLEPSPIVLVVTGLNATDFFIEWTVYPQVPVQVGADFTNFQSLSNVYAYRYVVSIGSCIYLCRVWLGGPRE
ncbi:hypothetical protein H5T51_07685, partial [Candidatus Bathyarchaeota archaeon]|nr:hypothetical protein [Candidatus Bathyarchaeota archaeon]